MCFPCLLPPKIFNVQSVQKLAIENGLCHDVVRVSYCCTPSVWSSKIPLVLVVLLKFTVETCYNFEEHKHRTKSPIARFGRLRATALIRLSNYGELICVNERLSLGNLSHSLESLIWNYHTNWTRSLPAGCILLVRGSVPPTFVLSHIVNKRAIKLCVSLSRYAPDYDYRDARTRTPADVSRRSPPTKFRKPHKIRSLPVPTVYNLHHATHFGHYWFFKLFTLISRIFKN